MAMGIVVIDNNCFDELVDPGVRARFLGNLRAADLEPSPSEVNLLETVAVKSDEKRARLVGSVRALTRNGFLLKWPFAMLAELGEAIVAGKNNHRVSMMDARLFMMNDQEMQKMREETVAFNRNLEAMFNSKFEKLRVRARADMKKRGIKDTLRSSRRFLDEAWIGTPMRQMLADIMWERLGLGVHAPMDVIDVCEPWKIMVDVEGVALYERAMTTDLPKRVQWMDMIQLVYLGLAPRRILVTRDAGLLRVANAIFPGRYQGSRIVDFAELIA
jgi:hypothetical protein